MGSSSAGDVPRGSRPRRWRWAGIGLLAIAAAVVLLVDISVSGPRVSVRWRPDLAPEARAALEARYSLQDPEPDATSATTWHYELADRSRENLQALVADPSAEDTNNIDRDALTTPEPSLQVGIRPLPAPALPFPFSTSRTFENPRDLFQAQSLWLLLAGGVVLWASGRAALRERRAIAVAAIVLTGAAGWTMPISRMLVRMGDSGQLVESRRNFEAQAGVRVVRFEAHLTWAVLGQIDRALGRTEETPERAQTILARGATAAFVIFALVVGVLDRWSASGLRYLGLALLAPSALLYFGWREFAYLSLNVAAFPLAARGLRDNSAHLEAASLLAGLGAAFHGWGLASLGGIALAALVTPAPLTQRFGRLLRVAAWGTTAYAGWLPIYLIVLKLPVLTGHVDAIPWRPFFEDYVRFYRVNPAIFSADGARLLLMTGWGVAAPLLLVAASLWREHRDEVRTALAYAVPSCLLTLLVWHSQGPKEDMDVVFAIFPALYALIHVCALDRRRTAIAAAVLVSAHLAFWRILFDYQFLSRYATDA